MIKKIRNWFNVEPTGESFWDSIGCEVVYTYKYKHNSTRFLATSRFSFFRVNIN